MDIIKFPHTRELDKGKALKKCVIERLNKIDEKNYKKEGEIIIIRKLEKLIFVMGK